MKINVYHLVTNAAICFSKGGKYFDQFERRYSLNTLLDKLTGTNNIIVICHQRVTTCNPPTKQFLPLQTATKDGNFPVYLVKYSRFGIVNKYKYSYEKKIYINQ